MVLEPYLFACFDGRVFLFCSLVSLHHCIVSVFVTFARASMKNDTAQSSMGCDSVLLGAMCKHAAGYCLGMVTVYSRG
jgi:hypothetical protein